MEKAGRSEWVDIEREWKEGEVLEMVGVSVSWWNGEGKVVKNCDYARFV